MVDYFEKDIENFYCGYFTAEKIRII